MNSNHELLISKILNNNIDLSIIKTDNLFLGIILAKKMSNEPDTYIDIGVGDAKYLIQAQSYFKTVVGFEPSIQYTKILNRIKKLNYTNIFIYNKALSSLVARRNFYIDEKEPDLSSFNKIWVQETRKNKNNSLKIKKITTSTLDLELADKNLKKIDLIKIDAEDEDTEILVGAYQTIKKHQPIVQIETITPAGEKFLQKLGYIEYHGFDNVARKDSIDKFYILNT